MNAIDDFICNAFQRFSDWSHKKFGLTCFWLARFFLILFLAPCFYGAYHAFEGQGLEWVIGAFLAFGLLTILRDFLKKISWLEQRGVDVNERILKKPIRKALVVLTIVGTAPGLVLWSLIFPMFLVFMLPLLATAYFMACKPFVRPPGVVLLNISNETNEWNKSVLAMAEEKRRGEA